MRIHVFIPDDLLIAVDRKIGRKSRSAYICSLVEKDMGNLTPGLAPHERDMTVKGQMAPNIDDIQVKLYAMLEDAPASGLSEAAMAQSTGMHPRAVTMALRGMPVIYKEGLVRLKVR